MRSEQKIADHSRFLFVVAVQSLSCVQPFATPWNEAHQTPLSSTILQSLLKFMSIELVMLSNYLIFCWPLLLLPSIFPSIRVFSSELALRIRWPKYWSFSFSIRPSDEYSGLISSRIPSFRWLWVWAGFAFAYRCSCGRCPHLSSANTSGWGCGVLRKVHVYKKLPT